MEERKAYEKDIRKCSERGHIDVHTMILNRDELSSRKDEDIKNTLWYRVRKVNVTMNKFLFIMSAINNRGKTTSVAACYKLQHATSYTSSKY